MKYLVLLAVIAVVNCHTIFNKNLKKYDDDTELYNTLRHIPMHKDTLYPRTIDTTLYEKLRPFFYKKSQTPFELKDKTFEELFEEHPVLYKLFGKTVFDKTYDTELNKYTPYKLIELLKHLTQFNESPVTTFFHENKMKEVFEHLLNTLYKLPVVNNEYLPFYKYHVPTYVSKHLTSNYDIEDVIKTALKHYFTVPKYERETFNKYYNIIDALIPLLKTHHFVENTFDRKYDVENRDLVKVVKYFLNKYEKYPIVGDETVKYIVKSLVNSDKYINTPIYEDITEQHERDTKYNTKYDEEMYRSEFEHSLFNIFTHVPTEIKDIFHQYFNIPQVVVDIVKYYKNQEITEEVHEILHSLLKVFYFHNYPEYMFDNEFHSDIVPVVVKEILSKYYQIPKIHRIVFDKYYNVPEAVKDMLTTYHKINKNFEVPEVLKKYETEDLIKNIYSTFKNEIEY